jgi:uncharacterized protein (DUF58 family)
MMTALGNSTTGSAWGDLRLRVRQQWARTDRPGWRRFFQGLLGLSTAFFLALYSTALTEAGRVGAAVWAAAISLLLTGIVAVKVVPYLARRTALERWLVKIEYEFTREGVFYLVIIGLIAIAALNTGNNLLFIILASLLAAILVSGILSQIVLSQLELDFVLPDHVFAERPMISRLTVSNLKWIFPSFSVTVSARDAERKKRKKSLGPRPRQILDAPVYVPYIPHRSSVTQHVEITFPRRGRYTQEGFRVSSKFPFGFLRKSHEVPTKQEILVLPNIQPTEEFYEILPLIGGEIESFYKGQGSDLYAIRDYQEGDSARHVDWKASAKAQAVKVREFTREDERHLLLVFDARWPGAESSLPAQFEKAVNFCACLAWHFYEIDAQMQFLTDGFETPMAPAQEIIYPTLEALALIEPIIGVSTPSLLVAVASAPRAFNIIITAQPRGSIPTSLWGSSYLVFIDSL